MKQEINRIQKIVSTLGRIKTTALYDGIELSFLRFDVDNFSISHAPSDDIMVINYCYSGGIGWKMGNGNHVYLKEGDFSIHTMKSCADSVLSLPNGRYEGMTVYIDLQKLTDSPPCPLWNTGITGDVLYDKFCKGGQTTCLMGNSQTENIFQFFFNQPDNLKLPYQKIKVLELLLYLYKMEHISELSLTEYQSEQIEIVKQIHEQLLQNLDRRFTIETLSKKYLMNPTTMKSLFKSVYGTSIAAHMKEHRMKKAAQMLLESEKNISEIALAVGYDSQSKFSTAFREFYNMLPSEYRKKRYINYN